MRSNDIQVIVDADFALFTRPEFKTERVSYDVPTVSAIQGMLKAIYWKPAFRYVIDKIVVYNPIRFINIRRNEVKNKVSLSSVKKGNPVLYASETRTQRDSRMLKNVRYGIQFHLETTGIRSEHDDECAEKHVAIFCKRVKKGRFFRHPSLGCSENGIHSICLTDHFDYSEVSPDLKGDVDLGYMLYDLKYKVEVPESGKWEDYKFFDDATPRYFRPHMIDGVIDVVKYRGDIIC